MITYVPVTMAALFAKNEWKPIKHTESKTFEEITAEGAKKEDKEPEGSENVK